MFSFISFVKNSNLQPSSVPNRSACPETLHPIIFSKAVLSPDGGGILLSPHSVKHRSILAIFMTMQKYNIRGDFNTIHSSVLENIQYLNHIFNDLHLERMLLSSHIMSYFEYIIMMCSGQKRLISRGRSLIQDRKMNNPFTLCVVLFLLGFGVNACQSTSVTRHDVLHPSPSVMELWTTYSACQATQDLLTLEQSARVLIHAADEKVAPPPSSIPVPSLIRNHVEKAPSRVSVDPRALAASCSLLAGKRALVSGKNSLALEMFALVIKYSPDENVYYVTQANLGIRKAQGEQLVLTSQDPFLTPVHLRHH